MTFPMPHLMDLVMRAPGHRIALGHIQMTRALAACFPTIEDACAACQPYVLRHARADWGNIPEEDRKANEIAMTHDCPGRLFSAWQIDTPKGGRPTMWIITEADRSVTTLLLPSDN